MAGHPRHPLDDAFAAQNGTVHRAGTTGARRPDLTPIARLPRGNVENLTPVLARPAPGPKPRRLTPLLARNIMRHPATSLSQPIYRRPGDLAAIDVPAPAKTILIGAAILGAFYFLAH